MARGQVFNQLAPVEKPKRNGFDLSFANNFSTKFGTLTPVLCKEVIPGDTFNIKSTFGLKLMPMYFPVQTRMRARLHFFYVRNRNLWKNWKKFYRGDKNVVFPYIAGTPDHMFEFFRQGTLADYLGVPTTMVNSFTEDISLGSTSSQDDQGLNAFNARDYFKSYRRKEDMATFLIYGKEFNNAVQSASTNTVPVIGIAFHTLQPLTHHITDTSVIRLPFTSEDNIAGVRDFSVVLLKQEWSSQYQTIDPVVNSQKPHPMLKVIGVLKNSSADTHYFNVTPSNSIYEIPLGSEKLDISPARGVNISYSADAYINKLIDKGNNDVFLGIVVHGVDVKSLSSYTGFSDVVITSSLVNNQENTINVFQSGQEKISALPFRAYECIFNAIYRNTQNDPFRINGEVEYDQFNTTLEDGADSTDYQLFQDYWEKDFLTTCLPSPQDGNAPLLGFSSSSQLPNAASSQYVMRYTTEDGTHQDLFVRNNNGTLTFSNANNSGTLDKDLQGDLIALNSLSQFGLSINDLRNVNSLQRFLEKQIANGYRYKDIIEAHFGIEIALRELDMPEFIGGVTQDINVNAVTQTSEDGSTPLGWQSGNAGAFGSTEGISKYCDEHGFIIGILSVVPIPTYSQLLPKMFTKFGRLDYYSPEFAHIGLQPVKYREVCPIQAAAANMDLDTVFGYNRAFYDYLASTDEVHGEFRGSLRDFLINRVFSEAPQLGKEFLTIDPEQTNNIFNVVMANDDKIFGQVYFDITAERPIPLFNEPRLE